MGYQLEPCDLLYVEELLRIRGSHRTEENSPIHSTVTFNACFVCYYSMTATVRLWAGSILFRHRFSLASVVCGRLCSKGTRSMSELKKVAMFTNEYPPNVYGGAGVHVEYLSRELARLLPVEVRCFGDQDIQQPNLRVKGYGAWAAAKQNTDPRFGG